MRRLISFFVDNPLIVNVILVTLIIVGVIIGNNLPKESYPDITFNILRISTSVEGASMRDMELLVSKSIEDQLKTISGIEKFESHSSAGSSRVIVWLNVWGVDKYDTVQEIREAVSIASRDFPDNADASVIREIKANDSPIILYQLRSSILSPLELRDLAKNFQQNIEGVTGVAEVILSGYREREIQINFNNTNMLNSSISLVDLQTAVSNYIIRESAGNLNGPGINRNISLLTDFEKSKDISDINIRRNFNSSGVSVKHIASVVDGLEDQTVYVRGNLEPGITVSVYKEDAQDSFRVLDRVSKVVNEFKRINQNRYNRVPEDRIAMLNYLSASPLTLGVSDIMSSSIVNGFGYNLEITAFKDSTEETKKLLNITKNNAFLGIILVFLTLWLFLDFRIAFWTSFSIPVVMILSLIVVFFMGLSLNNIILFGMITVLGILVDDGIIVSENIYRFRSLGYSPREAAIEGVMQLAAPLTGTVLTTICAFLPLLLVKKIDFLYIAQIPLIVIITLIMSLVEVFLSLPAHIAHANTTKDFHHLESNQKLGFGDKIMIKIKNFYVNQLKYIVKWRYFVIVLFCLMGVLAYFISSTIKFVYYSNDENNEIHIRMKAPNGNNLQEMDKKVSVIENIILQELSGFGDPLNAMFTTVGSGSLTPIDGDSSSANKGTIRLFLTDFSDRKQTASDIVRKLEKAIKTKNEFSNWLEYPYISRDPLVRDFKVNPTYEKFVVIYNQYKQFKNPSTLVDMGYPEWLKDYTNREIQVTNTSSYNIFREEIKDFMAMTAGFVSFGISEPRFGPRQSNPIELQITGNNDDLREKAMQEIYNFLSSIDGVFSIEEKRNEKGIDFFINLNVRKMEQLGIKASTVASAVRTAFIGSKVGTVASADESIDIKIILPQKDRYSIKNLYNIPIPTGYNTVIPLKSISNLEMHQDISNVIRMNGKRTSALTADVDLKQLDVRQVGALLDRYIPEILVKYPGVGIEKAGELSDIEDTEREAMLIGMVGFVSIFFILLFIFRSLSQPIFVLAVLPFGVIGVIFAFAIHGQAMSFYGLIGLIGLMGVIINDSIVMVDYINVLQRENLLKEEKDKISFIQIVCLGSSERVRAILLTTITTVTGMLPSVYGWGGSVSILRPMAMAMTYGIVFGTFISLILVPCLYIINQDIQNFLGSFKRFFNLLVRKKNNG